MCSVLCYGGWSCRGTEMLQHCWLHLGMLQPVVPFRRARALSEACQQGLGVTAMENIVMPSALVQEMFPLN